jgi:Uma2 family endonuclease
MPTATQVSVSEYLSTTYRPDCEYLDGEVLERNLGEYDHSRLQMRVSAYLFIREEQWGIRVVVEQRVQVKARRFRIPDICVMLAAAPIEEIITHPPFLCIEILSKADTVSSMVDRLDDYLNMGVANVWVIDPRTRRGYRYDAQGMLEAKDGVLRSLNPDLAVPLRALFD